MFLHWGRGRQPIHPCMEDPPRVSSSYSTRYIHNLNALNFPNPDQEITEKSIYEADFSDSHMQLSNTDKILRSNL